MHLKSELVRNYAKLLICIFMLDNRHFEQLFNDKLFVLLYVCSFKQYCEGLNHIHK